MNVRKGDLAIIIKALLPENIGKIVEVFEPLGDDCGLGFRWRVKSAKPCRTLSVVDFKTIYRDQDDIAVPDAWMRSITGLPITDDIKDEVTA